MAEESLRRDAQGPLARSLVVNRTLIVLLALAVTAPARADDRVDDAVIGPRFSASQFIAGAAELRGHETAVKLSPKS